MISTDSASPQGKPVMGMFVPMQGTGPVAAPAGAGGAGFSFNEVLRTILERRKIIVFAGIAGLVLGILVALLTTPLYRAATTLEYNTEATEMTDATKSGRAQVRAAVAEAMGTQMGLLRSETLARRVVEDLNLAAQPAYGGDEGTRAQKSDRAVAILQANTTVEPVKGSTLISVSHVSSNPELAAKVSNGIAKGFINLTIERRFDSSSYARNFLSNQLAQTKQALENSERALNAYSIQSGVFRTPGAVVDGKMTEGSTLAAAEMSALSVALNEARVKRIAAEQAYKNGSVGLSADQVGNVANLIQQRADVQGKYDEGLKVFKPDYPAMKELKARIDRLDTTIAAERQRVSGGKRDELLGEFRAAQRTEQQLADKVDAAKRAVQSERSSSTQYGILQREADTNRAMYDALLQRYKEVGVEGGLGKSDVSIVDPAEVPKGSFKPNIPLNAIVGLLLGLGSGIGLAFALHLFFDAIIDPSDVRQKLHLPVLGAIPLQPEDRTLFEALADRKSDVSEAYYSVRTALKFSRPEGAPKVLLLTSSRPGEGKSTSAYAIAASMARLGTKVLLVDADLRKPTFVSSREDGYGLAHLLGTEEPLDSYKEATQIENLDLLPVGRFVGSPAELLSSNRLPEIIDEARKTYEMVVIDGPPVLGLTDAPLLGAVADAAALVIESRQSRTSHVNEILRRLVDAGTNVIGVILTKVSSGGSGYGYNYYSYSYGDDVGGKVSSNSARALDLNRPDA